MTTFHHLLRLLRARIAHAERIFAFIDVTELPIGKTM
jgi:hypothetical protein